ncbi:MAG: YlxR family protein [Chloroflexota bacterium]|nr:YlxR family protein [Chloroflexota bacterium]
MTIARAEPARTCVVTRVKRPKRELIRIVRTPEGGVRCDPSGRLDGRGAYVSMEPGCVQKALAHGILGKQLGVSIDRTQAESLIEHVERERLVRITGSAR